MAKQTIFSLIIVIMGRAVAMGHCLNFNWTVLVRK